MTLVIHRLRGEREKRARLEKLDMVIGTFFSEEGTELLATIADSVPTMDEITRDLLAEGERSNQFLSALETGL